MGTFKPTFLLLCSVLLLSESKAQSLCEQVHLRDPYVKRPIDSFSALNASRTDSLQQLRIPTEAAYRAVLKARKFDLIVEYSENFETLANNLLRSLSKKETLSPFTRAELFKSLISDAVSTLPKEQASLNSVLKIYLEKMDYQLRNPLDNAKIRERKATPEMREAIVKEFPELLKVFDKIEQMTSTMASAPTIARADLLPFVDRHPLNPQIKINQAPVEIQNAVRDIYNTMQSKEAFKQYMTDLVLDTAVLVKERGDAKEIEKLKQGIVPDRAALAVLVLRYKSRGTEIAIIGRGEEVTNEIFRDAAKKSAMLDFAFGAGGDHGQEIHFVQVDYAHQAVHQAMKGDTRLFWNYIGSKKGIWFWYDLFDSNSLNLTRPEYFSPKVREIINFK